jgi:hypothetical protein
MITGRKVMSISFLSDVPWVRSRTTGTTIREPVKTRGKQGQAGVNRGLRSGTPPSQFDSTEHPPRSLPPAQFHLASVADGSVPSGNLGRPSLGDPAQFVWYDEKRRFLNLSHGICSPFINRTQ